MKILITGVKGFVGFNLLKWFSEKPECEAAGLYRGRAAEELEKYRCIETDLVQPDFSNERFDVIIHAAAATKAENLDELINGNMLATKNLLDYAKLSGCSKFLFLSSNSVFGDTEKILTKDSARINPDDYGTTKYLVERLVQESDIAQKTIIRLPKVLGRGYDYTNLPDSWIPRYANKLMRGEEIHYYNPTQPTNNCVYIDDMASFLFHRILSGETDLQLYTLGSGDFLTTIEIIQMMKKELGSTSALKNDKRTTKSRNFAVCPDKAIGAGFLPRPINRPYRDCGGS